MPQSDQNDSVPAEAVHRMPSMWVPVIVAAYHAIGASLTVRFNSDGTATIVATFLGNDNKMPRASAEPRADDSTEVRLVTRRSAHRWRRSSRRVTSQRNERTDTARRAKN